MTDEKMALFELIETRADVDFVREMLALAAERLMSFEAEAVTGAAYGVKLPDRTAQRNGYRERTWDTRVGAIDLKIPRLRTGSYLPSFLDPRKTAEKALVAVIQEAYVQGVSTRGLSQRCCARSSRRTKPPQRAINGAKSPTPCPRFPATADLMDRSEDDVLAYMAFPKAHWAQISSTNPLERLNKEIKRRADVVGIFPNEDSIVHLVGALMLEQTDEWAVSRRYMTLETLAPVSDDPFVSLPGVTA